jgi:uncharacterized tellurite resistance protein B-like protein
MPVQDLDQVFNSGVRSAEQLSAKEARLALAALIMWSDGAVHDEELRVMSDALLDGKFDQQAMQAASTRVSRIYQQEGPGALFNAAAAQLSVTERTEAFELAVRTALADHRLTDAEQEIIGAMAQALGIPAEHTGQLMGGA